MIRNIQKDIDYNLIYYPRDKSMKRTEYHGNRFFFTNTKTPAIVCPDEFIFTVGETHDLSDKSKGQLSGKLVEVNPAGNANSLNHCSKTR
jgi:hypothetical protein